MPASSSVRSNKDPGRTASSLARVLYRKRSGVDRSATLMGCDPGNFALRRRGTGTGGIAVRRSIREEPHAPPQAILRSKSGMEAERNGA